MSDTYRELADRAEHGELRVKPGTIRRGPAATEETRLLLMEATETDTLEDMTRVALGRPKVGAARGASPVVRARVPQALKDRVLEVAEREHVNESDVVRAALAAYVAR